MVLAAQKGANGYMLAGLSTTAPGCESLLLCVTQVDQDGATCPPGSHSHAAVQCEQRESFPLNQAQCNHRDQLVKLNQCQFLKALNFHLIYLVFVSS